MGSRPSNKEVALVVGASRGIGRQVAIDLAKNGYYGESHDARKKREVIILEEISLFFLASLYFVLMEQL